MSTLSDWELALEYFDAAGISTPPWEIVSSADEVRAALSRLRLPIAVKAVPGGGIDHKTELGLVATDLADLAAVGAAAQGMFERLPDGSRLMLQEMFYSHVEMLLSVRRDPDFGPIATVGHGGRLVEVFQDWVHLALPIEPDDVVSALDTLRVSRMLRDFRGFPDRDLDALVHAVCALADRFSRSSTTEIEINPLMVGAVGEGVVAVDVVLYR